MLVSTHDLNVQLRMRDYVLLDLLIDAGRAHACEGFFGTVDRNHPGAVGPIRQLHRSVCDDGVVFEVTPAGLDQLLSHHRFATHPRTQHHGMAGSLHGLEFLEPLLDRELFFVIVIFSEEIAVFAMKVAAVGYVDGSDRNFGNAEDEEFGDIAELAEFTTNIHRRSLCDRIYLLSRALDCYLLLFVGVDLDLSARFDDRILTLLQKT